jgi:hypothetical protein
MTDEVTQWTVERVQTGVRMEKRLLKVLKALAELLDLSLGDLLEGIVLHAFDGRAPFSDATRRRIAELKAIYGLDLDATASHRLVEASVPPPPPKGARAGVAGGAGKVGGARRARAAAARRAGGVGRPVRAGKPAQRGRTGPTGKGGSR